MGRPDREGHEETARRRGEEKRRSQPTGRQGTGSPLDTQSKQWMLESCEADHDAEQTSSTLRINDKDDQGKTSER